MEYIHLIIDFVLHIDVHMAELVSLYGTWIYAILFLIIFCETGLVVTPFLPGDSLLFVAGALAALPGNPMNVHLIVLSLILAAVLGDASNYTIGRLFGERLFGDPKSKIFKQSYPIVRTFAPFVAGMGHMSYRHFALFNVVGGLVWVALFSYAGYFFGGMKIVQENLKLLIVLIIFVSILPAVIEVIRNKYFVKDH